jgi:1-acyl-sn-glycerol-3-phosphate acyltransferase
MTLDEFHAHLRAYGAYRTPPEHLPARQTRGGAWAAWRFYTGGVCRIVTRGLIELRHGGDLDARVFAELAYVLLRAAERLGTLVTFDGFAPLLASAGPCVFVANHMSLVETIVLPAGLTALGPLSIVAKRSLTRYPGFGRILLSTHPVIVTRHNPRQDLTQALLQGTERLRKGYSVLLFPQGTRSDIFDARRFNSMGVKLAKRAGVPLVPVAVKTDFARTGRWLRDFGPVDPSRPIRFVAGPPLPGDAPQRELQARCTGFIAAQLRAWGLPVAETDEPPAANDRLATPAGEES